MSKYSWCFILFFLLACSESFELSPQGAGFAGNPANQNAAQFTQTLVFQGVADIAAQNPETWDVPLPLAAVEARLYVFGHQLTTLYYSELPEHTHPAPQQDTSSDTHNHIVRVFLQTPPGSFWGSLLWNSNCGTAYVSHTNNTACSGTPLFSVSSAQHDHTFTPIIDPAGIAGVDADQMALAPAYAQKTYLDHLQILVDGEDVTNRFNLNPLGDGSKDHELNGNGASADLSSNFSQAGHHRVLFKINAASSPNSLGGRLNYVLWVRIPLGPWEGSTP